MKQARDILIEIFLDFWNNYLTIERFAECNGLEYPEAYILIELAKAVYNTPHPEA